LFPDHEALVLTVWQPISGLGSFAWDDGSTVNLADVDHIAADDGCRVAEQGLQIARGAGMLAKCAAVEASGSVWETIVAVADRHRPAVIVMGSRGLSSLRSILVGSVSSAVVHHAHRPTLVIPPNGDPSSAVSSEGG
jgi:nucleotide-binding universal stress UspA family protein